VKADLYKGKLNGHASLDVVSRQMTAFTETTFDYHLASVLLDPPVQRWLSQFAWQSPPFIQTEFAFRMPPWTNAWNPQRILHSLTMSGRFEGRGSFRDVPLGLAQSHFTFTNFVWTLPDLKITRPEGTATVFYIGNVTNQIISASLESQIDPAILSAAFHKSFQPAFEMVRFSKPPLIRAEIRGDLDDLSTVTARGTFAATNFFAKEQAMSDIRTGFFYTNQTMDLTDLLIHRGTEEVRVPFAKIDFPNELMFVTNVLSTIDPYIAMSIVGDEAYEAINPYRFATAPTVTVNGFVPLRDSSKADLYFEIFGTDFSFWRFHLPTLSGNVHWKGFDLTISNVHATFYNGNAQWSGRFKIDERRGSNAANFSFRGITTDTSLQPLVRDLFATTNRLEGILNGELIITSANTTNINSWNGFGHAELKDGYLWSIPIFGVFSPAMEAVAPGLGHSPVSSGNGNFTMTNSVIYTRDFQVRATAFRLDYKGNVDLNGKLDARVDAELLRDTWIVGRLFSTALWPVSKIFEARVTGTLNEPKTNFRYVPKFLFAPFKVLGLIAEVARKKEKTGPELNETGSPTN
jgi:hypothetical protein